MSLTREEYTEIIRQCQRVKDLGGGTVSFEFSEDLDNPEKPCELTKYTVSRDMIPEYKKKSP